MNRGINVDLVNPAGRVTVGELAGVGIVRFPLNTLQQNGNIDINANRNRYRDYIQQLIAAGITPLVVITHQTFGEGQGFNFSNLSRHMSDADWERLFNGMRYMTHMIIGDMQGVWLQVANEQDSMDDRASVIIPPAQYGLLVRKFRAAFPSHILVSGGYNSGAGRGIVQLKASGAMPFLNYIANHPYGQGAGGINAQFGQMRDEIAHWKTYVPAAKVLVTEFGINNTGQHNPAQVAMYMRSCFAEFANAGIAGGIWYGYDNGMDNHLGVRANGVTDPTLRGLINSKAVTPLPPVPQPPADGMVRVRMNGSVNIRASAGLAGVRVGVLRDGDYIKLDATPVALDGNIWVHIQRADGMAGWVSVSAVPIKIA